MVDLPFYSTLLHHGAESSSHVGVPRQAGALSRLCRAGFLRHYIEIPIWPRAKMGSPPDAACVGSHYRQDRRLIEVELSSPGGNALEPTAVQRIDNITRVQTLVIGGGQAGLCVGYYLRKQQAPS